MCLGYLGRRLAGDSYKELQAVLCPVPLSVSVLLTDNAVETISTCRYIKLVVSMMSGL